MFISSAEIADVPAVLPGSENDEEREKLINQAAETSPSEEKDLHDDEGDDLDEVLKPGKPSKKRLFVAFAGFVLFFVVLLAVVCWFFGIGFFAAAKTKPVDRTSRTNASSAPVTEEEKLKMALNIVADKNPTVNPEQKEKTHPTGSEAGIWSQGSSLNSRLGDRSGNTENLTLPPDGNRTGSVSTQHSTTKGNPEPKLGAIDQGDGQTSSGDPGSNGKSLRTSDDTIKNGASSNREVAPAGRSLFFGKERKQDSQIASQTSGNIPAKPGGENIPANSSIPFGSILPLRLVGSVYTLRNSAGFVRMELTRSVEGKGFAYPAGTVVVGTLRGSEYKRAFISVVGLIDPRTGNLVKFSGEVLGNDGASGMSGRRRKISSVWSRALAGLRDAGTAALGALGNLRSGGTVDISDSTQKASGVLTGQISDLAGSKQKTDEFVEIAAGTNGFVLVTNLPGEDSKKTIASPTRTGGSGMAGNSATLSGLTDEELADLFSGASPDKLRAAMPRMTPEFRRLAEQALASLKSE
jgi:hypothetical protein